MLYGGWRNWLTNTLYYKYETHEVSLRNAYVLVKDRLMQIWKSTDMFIFSQNNKMKVLHYNSV